MKPEMLNEELVMFRDAFRKFVEKEITPYNDEWNTAHCVSRDLWRKAGEQGFLCMDVPEVYGGGGVEDYRYNVIVTEELIRASATGVGFPVHNDMVAPYIRDHGTEAQKQRWLPRLAAGEMIGSVAMTEPNTGSDLAAIRTTAVRHNDHYLLNGQKTFISNGTLNDLAIVVAKTDPDAGTKGVSLLVAERGMAGYERGRNLEKIGMHANDTAELFFHNVEVPAENLLGEEGMGFYYLMQGLAQERLIIAAGAITAAETALEWTINYCRERTAFGRPIGKFQHSRFKLAEMKTEVEIGRVFIDHCIALHNQRQLTADKAAMAKWWITELQGRVVDQCLQLHGGYGYMLEYPIARAYLDSRSSRIYGGTNEIMKEVIGRGMGF
ncbi:MAG: acyl-CoA dehydrogenase family protein [Anaerolineae bacterium]